MRDLIPLLRSAHVIVSLEVIFGLWKSAGDAGDGAEHRSVYGPHHKLLIRRGIRMVAGDAGDVSRPSAAQKKRTPDASMNGRAVPIAQKERRHEVLPASPAITSNSNSYNRLKCG
jgi:hypothetical protein